MAIKNTPRSRQQKGLKPKDLCGVPWRLALALQADGWWLRSDIIWAKDNPLPESVKDRPTKSHEYVFLLTKSAKYFWDGEAVKEDCNSGSSDIKKMLESKERIGSFYKQADDKFMAASRHINIGYKRTVGSPAGRNLRTVWNINTEPFPGAHFATFPKKLVEPMIKAGTSESGVCPKCGAPWKRVVEKTTTEDKSSKGSFFNKGKTGEHQLNRAQDGKKFINCTLGWEASCACESLEPIPATVLDPFGGAGTTGLMAAKLGRNAILIEIKPEYADMAAKRISAELGMLAEVELFAENGKPKTENEPL